MPLYIYKKVDLRTYLEGVMVGATDAELNDAIEGIDKETNPPHPGWGDDWQVFLNNIDPWDYVLSPTAATTQPGALAQNEIAIDCVIGGSSFYAICNFQIDGANVKLTEVRRRFSDGHEDPNPASKLEPFALNRQQLVAWLGQQHDQILRDGIPKIQ